MGLGGRGPPSWISSAIFYEWQSKLVGLELSDDGWLQTLERKNARRVFQLLQLELAFGPSEDGQTKPEQLFKGAENRHSEDVPHMMNHPTRARNLVESLSSVELEFLARLVAGESQATIASYLRLTDPDALAVRRSLMRKLQARSTADAVREGIYAGL